MQTPQWTAILLILEIQAHASAVSIYSEATHESDWKERGEPVAAVRRHVRRVVRVPTC